MSRAEREVWLGADRRSIPVGRSCSLRMALAPDPPSGGGFTLVVNAGRSRTTVRPVGELDLSTADQLEQSLTEVIEAAPAELVLDLQHLHFCDAAGLHVLLRARERAGQQGTRVWLERPTRTVRRVLEISDLGWMIEEPRPDGA